MSKHTPGPWEVITELRASDEIVCDMLNSGYVAITKGQKLANWRDDAKLISAAPDLLEALEALIEDRLFYIEGDKTAQMNVTVAAYESARAAIAKARGES